MTSIYFLYLILIPITQSAVIHDLTQNVLRFTPKDLDKSVRNTLIRKHHYKSPGLLKKQDIIDVESAKKKANMIKVARDKRKGLESRLQLFNLVKGPEEKERYQLDSLPDFFKSSRRKYVDYNSSIDTSSSSLELKDWKEEWRELWSQKKLEAINSSRPKGDMVNMAAARPWGRPCGDPNQHDIPWGTCMLPMECEAEYRIYRGDYFCGRTSFICCALQLTTYDMYQGFDVSFASFQTDSEEKKNRNRGSKERKRRKKFRERRKRLRDRLKRKRKMKRNIRKIIREIQNILNRSYRNGTTERKRKTRQLKKFVKLLKRKYKEERRVITDLHEVQIIQTDAAVQEKLQQIKNMNQEFIKNGTFRDIVINGTINAEEARMLMRAYPDLGSTFKTRRGGEKPPRDSLDYDIEYGYLYY